MSTRVFHYDDVFKEKYVNALRDITNTIQGVYFDLDIEDIESSQKLVEGSVVEDSLEPSDFVINEDDTVEFYFDFPDFDDAFTALQSDIPILLSELEKAEIYNNCEYFHENRYMLRVSTETFLSAEDHLRLMFAHSKLESKGIELYVSNESSFHFSYKLQETNPNYPASCSDCFIVIIGQKLGLEDCRKITKSFIFEVNATTGLVLTQSPSIEHYFDDEPPDDFNDIPLRNLIICDHTDKVIEIYNKAISCEDKEIAILYFAKVIEFVSETVVRSKITEEGRKALLSNRAMNPNANFIKELQQMFKNHSYQTDSESLKLTVQTCGYFKDIESIIPAHIKGLVRKELQKRDNDALGVIADSITATRNSIAHAKANYRTTGKEIPEVQYEQLGEVMRILSQHCIRWFAGQNESSRVV